MQHIFGNKAGALPFLERPGHILGSPDSIARAVSEGFCSKLRFGNRRNPLRISRFSNRSVGAKDPLTAAAD